MKNIINKCVICHKKTNNKKTCSWRCAGKLAARTRKNNIQNPITEAKKRYSTLPKKLTSQFIGKCGEALCPNGGYYFDFFGAGLSCRTFLRKSKWNIVSADNNKKLWPEMDRVAKLYKGKIAYDCWGKMDDSRFIPVKEDIVESLKRRLLSNRTYAGFSLLNKNGIGKFDVIWLDFCGPLSNSLGKILEMFGKYQKGYGCYLLFMNINECREKLVGASDMFSKYVKQIMPTYIEQVFDNKISLTLESRTYRSGKNHFRTYGFLLGKPQDEERFNSIQSLFKENNNFNKLKIKRKNENKKTDIFADFKDFEAAKTLAQFY